MAQNSQIEWTESTWNPVTGCTKISPGCQNCYAERMALRLKAMGQANYADGFAVKIHRHAVSLPLGWKKPQTVFVNSMSDLFHDAVPVSFIREIFDVMAEAKQHRFQILTKRAERLEKVAQQLSWPENIWAGVSVESAEYLRRLDCLRNVPAAIRFVSMEPLLGPLANINLASLDWVIVGGESGPRARPMRPEWVRSIRDQCATAQVPFFFKQWGGTRKKKTGRELDGQIHSELPKKIGA